MFDIEVFKQNECWAFVRGKSISIEKLILNWFRFHPKAYRFDPRFKSGHWDGFINLYSPYRRTLPLGLVPRLVSWAEGRGLEYKLHKGIVPKWNVSEKQARAFIESLHIPDKFENRDYQFNGFFEAINRQRMCIISPTSSGKSMLIYFLARFFLSQNTAVPVLVLLDGALWDQMYGDFEEYAAGSGFDLSEQCQTIHGGTVKEIHKPLIISTWQSIQNMPPEYLTQFKSVIGDEIQIFKAKMLSKIMFGMVNAWRRVGFTATLGSEQVNKLTIEGHFGVAKKITTLKSLIKRKQISTLSIKCIVLRYPDKIKKAVKKYTYEQEIDYLIHSEARTEFIASLVRKMPDKNVLVLFRRVDQHGKFIFDKITDLLGDEPNRKVFFVSGDTPISTRNKVRAYTETHQGVVIVASYGVYAKGVNIRNLQVVVYASPSKSYITVLQSIGRSLRLDGKENKALLIDVVDDLSWKSWKNYAYRHFLNRYELYNAEGFAVSIFQQNLGVNA